jgi:methenyltetrahydromethanopterin cyclohydrolase
LPWYSWNIAESGVKHQKSIKSINSIWFFFFLASSLAVDCSQKKDGIYEAGCKSYAKCTGGVATIVECDMDKVFNNGTQSCDL